MNVPFEAKYINIKWEDSKTASQIYESRDTIDIEIVNDTIFKLEAITYKKIEEKRSGQLAFRIIDTTLKSDLFFINSQNRKVKLLSVKDNETGKYWWVEDGKEKHLRRTVGEIKVVFGDCTCIVHIRSLSFTYDELDLYLKDFRSDLWELIQRNDSYILGEAKTKELKVAKIELAEKFSQFIKFTNKILSNPKQELTRETQLQKASQVHPIPKTFIDLVTKGVSAKYLTGQGYKGSFDVAENRYIYALTKKLITLVSNEISIADKSVQELEKEFIELEKQIKSLSDSIASNTIIIDKQVVDEEIRMLHERENNELKKALSNQKQQYLEGLKTIFIQLNESMENGNLIQYWGKIKENKTDEWFTLKENNSLQLVFNKSIFHKVLKKKYEYRITAYYEKDKSEEKRYGGVIIQREFKYISEIEVMNTPQINRLLEAKKTLEKNDWKRVLKTNEKNELDNELEALKHKKYLIEDKLDEVTKVYNLLLPSLVKLKKIKKFFDKHKIKSRYHFPGSMTFIQNPNYQGAHKLFKQIMNKSGLNDELFENLYEVEKIGILDIPKVYERWCLLQIIKVLMDSFHFKPKVKDWKKILVKGILVEKPQNIILEFQNVNIQREVILTYEKVLKNRKTPDYVLDIKDRMGISHRFVLDAKFWETLEISGIIDKLYNEKNYAENGENSVFILHPSKSQKSYFGEKELFDWSSGSPNHKYGAIVLSPIQSEGNYLNDLQKLIGMFLQYGLEDNKNIKVNQKVDPEPIEKLFCIICGSPNQNIVRRAAGYVNYKYWVTCNDCSHMTIYSYCGKCNSRLVKNGTYWTYHAIDVLEPINVKCPYCGDVL